MKSQRKDGRGHWPAGKRRHPDEVRWGQARLALTQFLDEHFRRGRISARALADSLSVSDRTVRRWLAGEDRPAPEQQLAVKAWLAEQRAWLRDQRRK